MANPYDKFDSAEFNAFRQSAASGVGAVPKGAAILASRVAEQPIVDEFGRPVDESQMQKKPLSSVERMAGIKADPVYQAGEELQQAAREVYPVPEEQEKNWGVKFSRMVGGFLPLIGSGSLGPLTVGLQSIGDRMGEAYESEIGAGKTPEEAAAAAEKQALASGTLQATLFKFLPEPLKKTTDKLIVDRMSKSLVSEFFAKRGAQAVQGGIEGAASIVGENVIAGKPLEEGVGEGAAALSALQTLMPRGASAAKAKTPSEKILSRRVEETAPTQPVPEAEPTAGMLSGERSAPAATTLTVNGIEYTKTDKGWVTPEGAEYTKTDKGWVTPEGVEYTKTDKGWVITSEQPASEIVPPLEKQAFGGVEYTKTERGWVDPEGKPIDPSVEDLLPSAKALEDPKLLENPDAWADKVLADRKGQVSSNLDPELATAYVIKGSMILSRGVKDFATWSTEMVKEFGESIKAQLDVLWAETNKAHGGLTMTRRASGVAASPVVTDINFDRARRNLTSADQASFKLKMQELAPDATVSNAIGDWVDGAENSVAAVFDYNKPVEELRRLAASAGLSRDQKAALWWTTDSNGKDATHFISWPKDVSIADARQAMIDAGLANRTLTQTADGVQGFVFDGGQQALNKIEQLHEHSTKPSIESSRATGEFIGDYSSVKRPDGEREGGRVAAREAYRNVLGTSLKTRAREGVTQPEIVGVGNQPEPAKLGGGGVLSTPSRVDPRTGSKTGSPQPNPVVRGLADNYNTQRNLAPITHGHYVPVDESLAQQIAKAYDELPEIDRSPETLNAYQALAKEVSDQWDFAVKNLGIKFEPWVGEGQPYANSLEMVQDVRDNNHLYFFQGGDPHPFLNELDPKTGFTANDKFRAVHDLFGHASEGYQFGPRGEENAWIKHSQMFSPEAQRALSSETRGQNSWVNFGTQNYEGGVNKNIPAKDRPYAVQKAALLPEELTNWNSAIARSEQVVPANQPEPAGITSDLLASEPVKAPLATEVPAKPEPVKERPDLPITSALNTLYAGESSLPVSGKRTNAEIAQQIQEAAIDHWGGEPVTSKTITPDQESAIVNNAFEEVLAGLKQGGNAADWYTTAVKKALAIARVLHPELASDEAAQAAGFSNAKTAELGMATALAITSQNLNVTQNTRYANEQFKILKETGRFDPSIDYGTKAESISGNLELANKLLDLKGWDGVNELLNKEFTVGELSEIASQITGKKTKIAGRVSDVVNGSALFGPKIGGGFLQNLLGNFNPVTVDLWMRRTWGRWTGDVLPDPVNAVQIARMVDGLKEVGIPLPEVLKGVRTVSQGGKKGTTMSEKTAERLLSNPESVNKIYSAADELDSRWNKVYDQVRNGITPEQAVAVRDGSLSLEALSKQLVKPLRDREAAWVKFKEGSETKLSNKDRKAFYESYDASKGRTENLTNDDLSGNKPTWAKAARVISNILKPIDVPSDQDREVINRIVNKVRVGLEQRGMKTTNADIQAILWYPEKDIWAKLAGDSESNLKNSYDEEFLKLAKAQGLGEQANNALQAFNQ